MPVYKNEDNGTWYVLTRYVDWKGERKQKCKRGFETKREAQEWERVFKQQSAADISVCFTAIKRKTVFSRFRRTICTVKWIVAQEPQG